MRPRGLSSPAAIEVAVSSRRDHLEIPKWPPGIGSRHGASAQSAQHWELIQRYRQIVDSVSGRI